MSSFERVIMVLENHVHVVTFEKRYPVLSIAGARSRRTVVQRKRAVRWISRNVVVDQQIRTVDAIRQRLLQPIGLCAFDGRVMTGVQQHNAQIIAEVQNVVAGLFVEAVMQREEKWGRLARLSIPAV